VLVNNAGIGLIINFGSLAAALPIPFRGFVSASKAARSRRWSWA